MLQNVLMTVKIKKMMSLRRIAPKMEGYSSAASEEIKGFVMNVDFAAPFQCVSRLREEKKELILRKSTSN